MRITMFKFQHTAPTPIALPLALALTLVALTLTLLFPNPARAQDELPGGMTAQELNEAQLRVFEASQPGEEHALIATLAGEWSQVIRLQPAHGAEILTFEGTSTNRMVLGGRFLMIESTLRVPGAEAASLGFLGFDRRTEEFTLLSMDEVGTYWVTGRGTADESGRVITMSGEDYDPIMDHTQEYDFVYRLIDDDKFVFEIWFKDDLHTQGGDPLKMIEITSTRAESN